MPVCYLKQKRMINKQLITRRFSRAVESYNREAVAQKQIAYRMSDMLNHYLPRPCGRILEIGSGTGFLTRRLMETTSFSGWRVSINLRVRKPVPLPISNIRPHGRGK